MVLPEATGNGTRTGLPCWSSTGRGKSHTRLSSPPTPRRGQVRVFHMHHPSFQVARGEGRRYQLENGQPTRLPDPSTPLVDRPHVVVMDHKTTSGKRAKRRTTGQLEAKWAHTPETLLTNVQAVLYAHSEMERWGVDEVTARWVYYLTSGDKRDAWAVEALFTRDHTQAAVAALTPWRPRCTGSIPSPKNVRGVALTLDPPPTHARSTEDVRTRTPAT